MVEHVIPHIVFYQALNFFGLLIILFLVVRKKIPVYFRKRQEELTAALREAKRLKQEAEAKYQEYSSKIKSLENETGRVLEQIRKEGEETRKHIIEEARHQADWIKKEAARAAENEIDRAKSELYKEVLGETLEGARGLLSKSVAEKDQLRLQKEFVEKIEVVQ